MLGSFRRYQPVALLPAAAAPVTNFRTFRRLIGTIIASLGLSVSFAQPVLANVPTRPSLTGEQLTGAPIKFHNSCQPDGSGAISWAVSGTAGVAYVGTFRETGIAVVAPPNANGLWAISMFMTFQIDSAAPRTIIRGSQHELSSGAGNINCQTLTTHDFGSTFLIYKATIHRSGETYRDTGTSGFEIGRTRFIEGFSSSNGPVRFSAGNNDNGGDGGDWGSNQLVGPALLPGLPQWTTRNVAVPTRPAATPIAYNDSVFGLELPPSQASGIDCSAPQVAPFFGGAAGDLPGSWYALVPHTNLSTSASICPGGQFALATQLNGQQTFVVGSFVSGSVMRTSSSCPGIQTYQVSATLTIAAYVGGQVRIGTGSFQNVTLIHLVDAACNAFFAIVVGPVSLTF